MSILSKTEEYGRLKAVTAILGAIGVILGAFGAHALKETLETAGSLETWHTAVLYHLVHSVAAFSAVSGARKAARIPIYLWIAGIVLFSGSLYGLALGGPKWMGPITPIGGLALILGWIWAAFGKAGPER